MKNLRLQLLIHHSGTQSHCDLRKYSMRTSNRRERVTCRICLKILDLPRYKFYYTIHHLGRFSSVHFEEDDLRQNARKICGFSNKKIDNFLRKSYTSTSGGDFVIYKHQRKNLEIRSPIFLS